jgi:hypothetical protein
VRADAGSDRYARQYRVVAKGVASAAPATTTTLASSNPYLRILQRQSGDVMLGVRRERRSQLRLHVFAAEIYACQPIQARQRPALSCWSVPQQRNVDMADERVVDGASFCRNGFKPLAGWVAPQKRNARVRPSAINADNLGEMRRVEVLKD